MYRQNGEEIKPWRLQLIALKPEPKLWLYSYNPVNV